MRRFVINVNGNQYDVEVEEVGTVTQPMATTSPVTVTSTAAYSISAVSDAEKAATRPTTIATAAERVTSGTNAIAAEKAAPRANAAIPTPTLSASASIGTTKINAPMPGTILDVKIKPGSAIKKGDVLMILEAMKMENEIVSPQDGTIASVNISKGSSVNSGDLLASING